MSIDVQTITEEQAKKIFLKGESHFCEIKSKDIQPKKLAQNSVSIFQR